MSLNSYAINKAVLNGVGNNQFAQALTVSSSSTFTIRRAVGVIRSVTSTSTVVKLAAASKFITYVSSSTASVLKAVVKSAFVTSSTTTSTLARAFLRTLSVSSSTTNTLVKAIAHTFTVSSTSTATLLKTLSKTISRSVTATTTLVKANSKTFTVASSVVATLTKRIATTLITYGTKILNPSALNDSVLNDLALNSGQPSYVSSAGIGSYTTLSINNVFNRTLSVVQSTTTTMVRALTLARTLTANAVTSTVAMVRTINRVVFLLVVQPAAVTLSKPVNRLVLLITTVYTTVVFHFYKVLPNIADTLIVPARKVVIKVFAGFTSILVNKKDTQG